MLVLIQRQTNVPPSEAHYMCSGAFALSGNNKKNCTPRVRDPERSVCQSENKIQVNNLAPRSAKRAKQEFNRVFL